MKTLGLNNGDNAIFDIRFNDGSVLTLAVVAEASGAVLTGATA